MLGSKKTTDSPDRWGTTMHEFLFCFEKNYVFSRKNCESIKCFQISSSQTSHSSHSNFFQTKFGSTNPNWTGYPLVIRHSWLENPPISMLFPGKNGDLPWLMFVYSLQECNPLELSHSTICSGMVHSFHQPKTQPTKNQPKQPKDPTQKFPYKSSLPSHFLLFMWPFFTFHVGKSSSTMEHLSHV